MIRTVMILGTVFLSLTLGSALAATIIVPDDFSTIQAAIDAAVAGDEIIVREGRYEENIIFSGQAITLKSEDGPEYTLIDGGSRGSVVIFTKGEGHDTVLEGFTIFNGSGTRHHSFNSYHGGGILCNGASPTIRNNMITQNSARTPSGPAPSGGGGIHCRAGAAPLIEGNKITKNQSGYAGGISVWDGSPTITGNEIKWNKANFNGGGICCGKTGVAMITNNFIIQNVAEDGAGINCSDASPIIGNNTIVDNRAKAYGGGIHVNGSTAPTPIVFNTILWNNLAATGPEIHISAGNIDVSFCDVKNGWAGTNNIDSDPLFIDPAVGDYHIIFPSPCRSAGDRNVVDLPDVDFEGDPRIGHFVFPDIGADEFYTHFYINGVVSIGNDVTGMIVGWPNSDPVMLISGQYVLSTPYKTPYGDFWLAPPWNNRVHFYPIPNDGVRRVQRTVTTTMAPGSELPVQAIIGSQLSNVFIIKIR